MNAQDPHLPHPPGSDFEVWHVDMAGWCFPLERIPAKLKIECGSARDAGLVVQKLAELPSGTLLDEKAVGRTLHVSTRTVQRLVDRGEIPAGVRLGSRKVWFSDQVLQFLRERAEREAKRAKEQRTRLGARF